MDPNSDGTDVPKVKRQKVSIACDTCRTKKIKCDGNGPVCAPCAKRRPDSCTWNGQNQRNSVQFSRDQTQATDTRTHAQEEENRRPAEIYQAFRPSGVIQTTEAHAVSPAHSLYAMPRADKSGVDIPQQTWGFRPSETSADIASTLLIAATSSPPRSPIVEDNPTQRATSQMAGSLVDNTQSLDILVGSSTENFASQMRKAVQRKLGSAEAPKPLAKGEEKIWPSSLAKFSPTMETPDYVLPPRRKADQLMAIYWQTVHPFYPFLEKEETTHKYESLWTGETSDGEDVMFLCILNIIFALSCRLNEAVDTSDRQTSAHVFFCRCKELLDPWKSPSLQTIQVYLLLGHYLQITHEPHRSWLMIGTAIRTAQSLGLDIPETSVRAESPRERELFRKVWYGCVLMDCVIATMLGRPTMISTSLSLAVPYPLATNEDRHPINGADAVLSSNPPSDIDYFIKTLELCRIMQDIANHVHPSRSQTAGTVEDTNNHYLDGDLSIFDTDRKLVTWEKTTPEHLRVEGKRVPEPWSICARQAVMLRHRYLHVKLLSLRPILSAFIASDMSKLQSGSHFGSTLRHRIALQCSVVCVKVAQETIDLAHSSLPANPGDKGNQPAWWYNILFVYSAATVILAAQLRPSILSEIPRGEISKSWDRAIRVLRGYKTHSSLSDHLVTALHLLLNVMAGHHLQGKQEKQQLQQLDTQGGLAPTPERGSRPRSYVNGAGTLDPNGLDVLRPTHMGNILQAAGLSLSETPDASGTEDLELHYDPKDLSWLNTVPFEL